MDHAIDGLYVFYEISLDELYDEWKTGEYKNLSECPSYKQTSAYRRALNELVKGCYLQEYVEGYLYPTLKEEMDNKKLF